MSWLSNLLGRLRGNRPEREPEQDSAKQEIGGLSARDQALVDEMALDPRTAELKAELVRRAVALDVGSSPPHDRSSSCFGRVSLALPGETWPEHKGEPMAALCQINLTEMPFLPPGLDDLEFLSIFLLRDDLPDVQTTNGDGWCLRAYRDLDGLVEIAQGPPYLKPLSMQPRIVEQDYPCWEDVPIARLKEIEEDFFDVYEDLFPNAMGLKLGGWPYQIQGGGLFRGPWDAELEGAPEYVFQIDSVAEWMWGDAGIGYFARGTAPGHEDLWMLEWSCF